MKRVLEIIDSAVKRLMTPASMLVLMVVVAFAYMTASGVVAVREFEAEGYGKALALLFGGSFVLVYLMLFVASIRIGVLNLPL